MADNSTQDVILKKKAEEEARARAFQNQIELRKLKLLEQQAIPQVVAQKTGSQDGDALAGLGAALSNFSLRKKGDSAVVGQGTGGSGGVANPELLKQAKAKADAGQSPSQRSVNEVSPFGDNGNKIDINTGRPENEDDIRRGYSDILKMTQYSDKEKKYQISMDDYKKMKGDK